MMNKYWFAPMVYAGCLLALLVTWAVMDPTALHRAFDADGRSVFELATIPFYAAIIPLVWWKCPYGGSPKRRAFLCACVSCVAFFAVCKELDWHLVALHHLYPDVVSASGSIQGLTRPDGTALGGTPFKMRFLTNAGAPLGAKLCVLVYFGAFFGVFAALLAYYAWPLTKGFFKRDCVAWTMCCFGASGVMVQIMDRLPAWVRHARGLPKEKVIDATSSFCTCFEEGGEMMIALFALLAILQAHAKIKAASRA